MKHLSAMHRHLEGWFAEVITAGSDKTQLVNVEVGAEAGNAADVEGPCRLHQHHHHVVHSVVLKRGRSQTDWSFSLATRSASRQVVQVGE